MRQPVKFTCKCHPAGERGREGYDEFFDRFRKRTAKPHLTQTEIPQKTEAGTPEKTAEESCDSFSLSMDSLGLSLSKGSVSESTDYPEPEGKRTADVPDSISNEVISEGDEILDTYKVISGAIKGGMGSVWKVHHKGWNADLAMKRPQPKYFAEGSRRRKDSFIHECEAWINLGLHPNIPSESCQHQRMDLHSEH